MSSIRPAALPAVILGLALCSCTGASSDDPPSEMPETSASSPATSTPSARSSSPSPSTSGSRSPSGSRSASASNSSSSGDISDVQDGVGTGDFWDIPTTLGGMEQTKIETDAPKHTVQAFYEASDDSSRAMMRAYFLVNSSDEPTVTTSVGDPNFDERVLQSVEEAYQDVGLTPARRTVDATRTWTCVEAHNTDVAKALCATVAYGRVIETQVDVRWTGSQARAEEINTSVVKDLDAGLNDLR